jgi:hypothetical protein
MVEERDSKRGERKRKQVWRKERVREVIERETDVEEKDSNRGERKRKHAWRKERVRKVKKE